MSKTTSIWTIAGGVVLGGITLYIIHAFWTSYIAHLERQAYLERISKLEHACFEDETLSKKDRFDICKGLCPLLASKDSERCEKQTEQLNHSILLDYYVEKWKKQEAQQPIADASPIPSFSPSPSISILEPPDQPRSSYGTKGRPDPFADLPSSTP